MSTVDNNAEMTEDITPVDRESYLRFLLAYGVSKEKAEELVDRKEE